jgi:L-arabinose isomerase
METNATPYPNQEIWFVTGSQGLYGDDILHQVAKQSQSISEILGAPGKIPVQIVWKPVLTDAESIRRLCQEASASDTCVGVIVWMHTFSPAKMWIAGLSALDRPLLHLHTQYNLSLPWPSIDMDFMNLNQAAHGDREFGHIESRLGIDRKIVAGHATDPRVVRRIAAWARAAVGRHASRTLRLARFGDNMRDVAVTEGDKVEAQLRFGFSVNTYAVNDLVAVVDAVEDKEAAELAAEYVESYDVVPALRPGGIRHDSLLYAARQEIGLRTFLTEGGFTAFTTNFEDLGGLRQLPGLAVQRLMADGYGFGGEGDWKTSALLRTMKVMGAGRPGGTTFMEDYTYHLGPGAPPCPRQPHLPRISWPATTPANTGPTPTTATRLPHPREQSVTGRRSTDIQLAP